MDKYKALTVLASITPQEAREMDRKIGEASKKITKRTHNGGKAFQQPVRKWHSRQQCGVCGRTHYGIRCPIGT